MQPLRVSVRNVRSARSAELHLRPFSALIGPNNAGKSSLIDAIRLFYGALAWDDRRDRPWDVARGEPSWVEITYALTDRDLKEIDLAPAELADDGIRPLDDDVLSIRRYLTDDGDRRRGNYYFVPANDEETMMATGWRELPARLGQCVYVPAVTRLEDQTATSGPSPLRDVMLLAFTEPRLDGSLTTLNLGLQGLRQAMEAGSVRRLEERLDDALRPWGLSARVDVGEMTHEFILRNLIDLSISRTGSPHSMESEGSGVQRALIAGLIQAAAQARSEDAQHFRWILFEEPEAFLHPAQVTRLAHDLRRIATAGNATVTISTHDPTMLSASRTPPEGIVRVHRPGTAIRATSHSERAVGVLLDQVRQRSIYTRASHTCFLNPPQTPPGDERTRVLYDLDPRRAAAFFADRVIVVEGFSDAAVFEWLDRQGLLGPLGANLGVLDAGGKYELHRAVATLSLFQIPHVVLWDEDAPMKPPGSRAEREAGCRDRASLEALRSASLDPRCTFGAVRLSGTIERWLGVPEERVPPWKALSLGTALDEAYADSASPVPGRVNALLTVINVLFDGGDLTGQRARPEFADCLITERLTGATIDIPTEIAALPRAACRCAVTP